MMQTFKKAISLLSKGECRELYIRCLLAFGMLDFKSVSTEELRLSPDGSNPYSDTGREYLQTVLSSFNITETDAIVDFGSGKGGALITLSDYPFAQITGVEISEDLVKVAKNNLDRLRIKNVTLICGDARDLKDIDDYNYFYFFNPFPCSVMQDVMANIKQSLKKKSRRITIIYLNPICHSTVTAGGFFKKNAEHEHFVNKFFIYTNNE
jgi:SAM-dependent methyltransferase